MKPDDAYQWLAEHSLEIAYLKSMGEVLGWDQRTHIPPKGHPHRHNQFAMLAKWIHVRATDPRIGRGPGPGGGLGPGGRTRPRRPR